MYLDVVIHEKKNGRLELVQRQLLTNVVSYEFVDGLAHIKRTDGTITIINTEDNQQCTLIPKDSDTKLKGIKIIEED